MKKVLSTLLVVFACLGINTLSYAQSAPEQPTQSASSNVAPININTADAQTIADNLYRVGIKKAEAIVMWREANGAFTSKDQLLEVKGIGEAILAANAERISLE